MRSIDDIDGLTYPRLISALNSTPDALLVLDNVSYESSSTGGSRLEQAISIVHDLLNATSGTRVIIRSRSIPQNPPLPYVYLGVMDEADTNQFISTHRLKENVPLSAQTTGEIHQISGGYAGAADKILNKLTYTRMADIATESSEMAVKNVDFSKVDLSLMARIKSLNSDEDDLKDLLSVFCVFPHGEDIQNIRNLRRNKPFYPMQSANLVRLGLLDTLKHDFFDREKEDLPKVVISSSSANEFIRAKDPDLYFELTDRALDLYFGKDWRIGKYKLGKSFSQETLTEFEYSTRNATGLLRRCFRDSVDSANSRKVQDSLGLINFYTAKLEYKCRFRELCELISPLLSELENIVSWTAARDILFRYASAMRMLKNFSESEDLYQALLKIPEQSNSQLSRLHLNLALLYDELDDNSGTLKHAKSVKKGHSSKSTYYHARSIVILRTKSENQESQLKSLEKKCISEHHFTAANNIALRVAGRFEGGETARKTYGRIAMSSLDENDLYNHVKACTKYVELLLSSKEEVPEKVIKSLKRCYDYARSQRLERLFRSAHQSLWEILEAAKNDLLLGRLMALSSRMFRLLQDEEVERQFLKKLLAKDIFAETWISERDLIYIEGRILTLKLRGADPESSKLH